MNYQDIIRNAQSYSDYREMIDQLMAEGKTTGANQSQSYIDFTSLNIRRMKRLDHRPELLQEALEIVQSVEKPQVWLSITEGWCGDAAQILPIVERLSEHNPNVLTKYVLRDEQPELMDLFLTNGARAIPKILFIDVETYEVLGSWGPRPIEAQEIMEEWKASDSDVYAEVSERIHAWFAKDKTRSTQLEFTKALKEALDLIPS
ncbi:thioredoxin family protein [Cryomorphaceae bacterium]|nr:thioredoxin family protein [Cryomorphaceae bacterium]